MLGVNQNATEDEVKAAYRKLVKKYHPDQYKGTDYEATANEKLKQINEAYDMIKNGRTSANNSYYSNQGQQYGGYGYNYNTNGQQSYGYQNGYNSEQLFKQIRAFLAAGRFYEAEILLKTTSIRNAEWYFLMGNVYWFRGWQLEAKKYYAQACNMDPANEEYRAAFNRVNTNSYAAGSGYRDPRYARARSNDDICDCCCKLWALDTLCECMGGDCIPCV